MLKPQCQKTPTYRQPVASCSPVCRSTDLTQKLCLEDEFTLLVLLTGLERLVVFPAHRLFALFAMNVSYDMAAGCHIPFSRLTL